MAEGEFGHLRSTGDCQTDVVIDAGGHIGAAALALAQAFPDATVISIEPDTENYGLLVQNCKGFPSIFTVRAALVREEGGQVALLDRSSECGYSVAPAPDDNPDAEVKALVDKITMSQPIESFDITSISILKLNIEGGEADLLDGEVACVTMVDQCIAELHDEIDSRSTRKFVKAFEGFLEVPQPGEKRLVIRHHDFPPAMES